MLGIVLKVIFFFRQFTYTNSLVCFLTSLYEFLLTLTFNLDVVKASSNKTATLKHKSVAVICCFHPYPLRSSSLNDLTFEKTLYDSFYIISVSITFSCEGHLCNEALSVSNSTSFNSSHIHLLPTVAPTDFFAKNTQNWWDHLHNNKTELHCK